MSEALDGKAHASIHSEMHGKMQALGALVEEEDGSVVRFEKLHDAVAHTLEHMQQPEEAPTFSDEALWALELTGRSREELVEAFVKHGAVRSAGGEVAGYDTEKSYKRLRAFAEQMLANRRLLYEPRITGAHMEETHKRISPCIKLFDAPDAQGRRAIVGLLRNIPRGEGAEGKRELMTAFMRFFIFLQLNLMFEPEAQSQGLVLVYDYSELELMFVLGMQMAMDSKLKGAMQKLVFGTFPVKMKAFYLVNMPWYLSGLFKLVLPFVPKKLKERLFFTGPKFRKVHEQVYPPERLPKELNGTGGDWASWPQSTMTKWIDALKARDAARSRPVVHM